MPEIVAEVAPESALALSWFEGEPGDITAPSFHRGVGEVLRVLHDLACVDDDPLSLERAFEVRCASWLRRAHPCLEVSALAGLERRFDAAVFRGASRVLCHRDVTPSNLIVSADRVHLIDFGQARPDMPLWDVVKLAASHWPSRECFVAFCSSYGTPDPIQLEQLLLLHGLQTACWGVEHRDRRLEGPGREVLEREGLH